MGEFSNGKKKKGKMLINTMSNTKIKQKRK
jgi:hypothetical protein